MDPKKGSVRVLDAFKLGGLVRLVLSASAASKAEQRHIERCEGSPCGFEIRTQALQGQAGFEGERIDRARPVFHRRCRSKPMARAFMLLIENIASGAKQRSINCRP